MAKIVVGYDGSEHAERALDRACELAEGGELVVVAAARAAIPVPGFPGAGDPVEEEGAHAALERAKRRLENRDITVRWVEAHGDPVDAIVEEAKSTSADLVVVGTRGLNLAQRALLGSVSTGVVHHAPCDVLIVR
jgi:nucleotide-binding universal stress UspA family protein